MKLTEKQRRAIDDAAFMAANNGRFALVGGRFTNGPSAAKALYAAFGIKVRLVPPKKKPAKKAKVSRG